MKAGSVETKFLVLSLPWVAGCARGCVNIRKSKYSGAHWNSLFRASLLAEDPQGHEGALWGAEEITVVDEPEDM